MKAEVKTYSLTSRGGQQQIGKPVCVTLRRDGDIYAAWCKGAQSAISVCMVTLMDHPDSGSIPACGYSWFSPIANLLFAIWGSGLFQLRSDQPFGDTVGVFLWGWGQLFTLNPNTLFLS